MKSLHRQQSFISAQGEETARWKLYPAYKDSGVEWLGELPEHWFPIRLKFISPESAVKFSSKPDDLPYIGLENIESGTGKLILDNRQDIVESSINVFGLGDILFGKLRPYLAKVYLADFQGSCTTELLVLKPRNGVISRFLFYSVLSDGFINIINSMTYGAKMPRASWQQVSNMTMPIPSLAEQRAIAAFLDRETAKIDALIAKKQRLIGLLQEKRIALISQVVTKGLDPNVPMKVSGIEWVGEVPKNWEVSIVKRKSTRIQTGSTPPTSQDKYYLEEEVPWFGPSSFGESLLLSRPVKRLSKVGLHDGVLRLFSKGSTMIVTIGATIGKVGFLFVDGSCNQQITAITFDNHQIIPKFGTYQLKRLERTVKAIAPNTTLPILDQQEIGYLPLVVPPITEQNNIISYLDNQTYQIDTLIIKVQTAIDLLKEYRTALISSAVTGKIDVSTPSPQPSSLQGEGDDATIPLPGGERAG